jgi:hypothetical protein
MGMYGEYARVTPAELDRVLRDPEWGDEFLDGLSENANHQRDPLAGERITDIDKAFHGIWYLLVAAGAPVDVVWGGAEVGGTDGGYGPRRYLRADEVAAAARYLSATPWDQLARHYVPASLEAADIYPSVIWMRDGDAARDFLRSNYERLVEHFAAAAAGGDAVVFWIS